MAGAVMSSAQRWLRNRAAAQPGASMTAGAIADMDAAIQREHVGRCIGVVLDEFAAATRQRSIARQRAALEHCVLLCSGWLHSTRAGTVTRHNRIFRLRQAIAEWLDVLHDGRGAPEVLAARVMLCLRDLARDAT